MMNLFDTTAKGILFAIDVAIIVVVLFMVQRFSPYSKDVYLQSFVIPMASQVNGRVNDVDVTKNQQVEAGDPLFQIDPMPYTLPVEHYLYL